MTKETADLIYHARQLAELTELGDYTDLAEANKALRAQARALHELADALEVAAGRTHYTCPDCGARCVGED